MQLNCKIGANIDDTTDMHILMRFLILAICLITSLQSYAEDFLDPLVAFKPTVEARDSTHLLVHFKIADGYYLYRDKVRFKILNPDTIQAGTPNFPKGKTKKDDNFGDVEVFFKTLDIDLPLNRSDNTETPLSIQLSFQGCAEAGICYPPLQETVNVQLPALSAQPTTAPPVVDAETDETSKIAQSLKSAGFFTNLFFFFLAGLGLSLTPCVFPMIPILSGIIAGQGKHITRQRGFTLSLAYVLGMAITYSAAGIAAGLTGTLISSALQNPWVLSSFALVFVVLSFSMFGFYDLQLPSSLQSKLSDEAGHLQGGRTFGVFVMGALSALIVGPCVAAPLAGALLYIGQTGNAVLGGSALFFMAFGMGVPLLVVGLSAGSLLPRAGMWMEGVKKFFGVLLLGTAIWLVSPVTPPALLMVAWATLLIIPAIYLHALDPLPTNAKGWQRFWKGCGIIMLIAGASLLVGVLSGSRDPLQPLAHLKTSGQAIAAEAEHLPFTRVKNLEELNSKLTNASQPVMLDFYADWCVSCKEMEKFTFSDPAVRAKLAGLTLLQVDVTANTPDDKALLQRFNLFGPPGIIFFNKKGEETKANRIVGFQNASTFLANLEKI